MFSSLLDLIYPPACFHCQASLPAHAIFCNECVELLTLLPAEGRCQKCFAQIDASQGVCLACRKRRHPYRRLASCFENEGPAKTLLHRFWKYKEWGFVKELASYLVVQLDHLHFPPFDLITFVPELFTRAPQLLAGQVATFLEVPLCQVVGRHISPTPSFFLKNRCNIVGKSILLVAMELHPRQSIEQAASLLQEQEPLMIFGITLCAS